MALQTTTKGSNEQELLPTATAMGQLMEVTTTSEAARYACVQAEAKFKKAGVLDKAPAQAMLRKLKTNSENVDLQRGQNGQPWSGVINADNAFENLQQNLAKTKVGEVASKIQDSQIVMDYAISDKGEFRRGLTVDGRELDAKNKQDIETIKSMDNLFNVWAAGHHLVSRKSVIYESDANGKILKDDDGNEIRADASEVRERMSGDKGFQQFMQDKGVDMTTRAQAFPGEEATFKQQKQQVAQPAAATAASSEEGPEHEGVRATSRS